VQLLKTNITSSFGSITYSSKKIIKEEIKELKQNHEFTRARSCMKAMKRLDKESGFIYRVVYNGDMILLKSYYKKYPDAEFFKGFFINTSLETLLEKSIKFINTQEEKVKSGKQNILKNLLKKIRR